MKPLTQPMIDCLCELYSEAQGRIGIAYPIKAHWRVIEGLYERGFIMRDAQIENGKVVRYIGFTPFGAEYSCEKLEAVINDLGVSDSRPRKCVSLFFEYDEQKFPSHVKAYQRVGELKASGDFRPTMIELLNMDRELEKGQVGLLMELYPEAVQTLRDMVRLELEADMQTRNDHVLKEMIRQTVKDAMQNTPQSPSMRPVSVPVQGNGSTQDKAPKQLTVAEIPPLPDEDDEDMEFEITTVTHSGANANFLKAIFGLQGDKQE